MGYYTRFNISTNNDDIKEALNEISGYGDVESDHIKWYSCQEDMIKVSLMFPDKVIKVSGEGEDSGDIWTRYAKNGKVQYEQAQIVVAPYDESKLK